MKNLVIPIAETEIVCSIRDNELEEEHVLHGTVEMLGIGCHVEFIHVEDDENGEQFPTKDPHERYQDYLRIYSVNFQTVEIPGFSGEWVMLIHPMER